MGTLSIQGIGDDGLCCVNSWCTGDGVLYLGGEHQQGGGKSHHQYGGDSYHHSGNRDHGQ